MQLFGSTPRQQVHDYELVADLQQILARVEFLEKDAKGTEKAINSRDEQLNSEYNHVLAEITLIKHETRKIRKSMKNLINRAQHLIVNLQSKVKKEDKDRIEQLTDEWAPEGYINKNSFIRLAGDEVRRALENQQRR